MYWQVYSDHFSTSITYMRRFHLSLTNTRNVELKVLIQVIEDKLDEKVDEFTNNSYIYIYRYIYMYVH